MAMDHAIWGSCHIPLFLLGDYKYDRLSPGDAVRILNLEPSDDFDSPLCGYITQHQPGLEVIDPDARSWYSAVSYTWGNNPKFSHKLFLRLDHQTVRLVHGNTKWALLPITYNVNLLLRHLRDAHEETHLWIDSVCINQTDQEEKARQIPLMSQIYAYANRVHIWLGENEAEDAQRAFSLLRKIELGGWTETDEHDFLCLQKFFNRPWFTRRWVIQEIFFANDAIFHCGHHTMSLSVVMAALFKAEGLGLNEVLGCGWRMLTSSIGLGHLQAQRQRRVQRRGLLPLLWDLHESECSDERDRIAAVYALADDRERAPLYYDIGGWEEMYMKIASHYLNNDTDTAHVVLLHLCTFGSIKPTKGDVVPSWVPDWSKTRQEPQRWESLPGWESPIPRSRINSVWSWLGMIRLTRWSRYRLKPSSVLKSRIKQWSGSPTSITEVSTHCLRVQYDVLTFIFRCGIVDHIVCPALSKDFWEEVVRLVGRHGVKDFFKRDGVSGRANKCHQVEVESLSLLLASVLAERGFLLDDVEKPIRELCAGLYAGLGHERDCRVPTKEQKGILRKIRFTMKKSMLLRVQTTVGYYWAIGPLNMVKGDWLTPVIPHGERVPHGRPYVRIARFMALRPTGKGERWKTWFPSPTSEPEDRFHRLWGFMRTKVEPAHIAVQFVGHGRSCIPFFDCSPLPHGVVMGRLFLQAVTSADGRSLPGPISFNIS